jgi:multidrug transporter EmrE-like cation transporter
VTLDKRLPAGVATIAIVFFLAATYVGTVGAVMLALPGNVSMALGAPLLGGLELAGPYMFLLLAALGALMGWGLLRLNRWARRAVILVALLGIVELVPTVSIAVVELRAGRLIWGGLGVIVRVMIVWYLYQEPVAEAFRR